MKDNGRESEGTGQRDGEMREASQREKKKLLIASEKIEMPS